MRKRRQGINDRGLRNALRERRRAPEENTTSRKEAAVKQEVIQLWEAQGPETYRIELSSGLRYRSLQLWVLSGVYYIEMEKIAFSIRRKQ